MIIIDAGHGGFDPGGGTNIYFKEKDLTKKIANYQHMRFQELGIDSVLVRPNDTTLNPEDRIKKIIALGATPNDILISNHINNGGGSGGEVIYSIRGDNELPQLIANNLDLVGLPIRNVYTKTNPYGKDYYFILRDSPALKSMIIEYGFADNEVDTKRLLYEWPSLAESVVKSIADYAKVPYTKPNKQTYVIKPNDSLYKIASKFSTTIDKIKEDNNLISNTIYPGGVLII